MTPNRSELALIDFLAARFPRSPLQINATHESDAELVRLEDASLPGGTGRKPSRVLAVTIDTLEEEIETGLYTDPYMIGWVACIASLSDLAATGSSALGIVMSETIPPDYPDDRLERLQEGIRDACNEAGTYLLGGDTNVGRSLRLTGCAVGLTTDPPMRRAGMSPGDLLYATGPLGAGNAFALARLLGNGTDVPPFRPAARLREGLILTGFASACMDSSDGLFTTIAELMRINGVGVELDAEWESWLEDAARTAVAGRGLPPWIMLAGEHGEYELIFAVSPGEENHVRELSQAVGRPPIRLGTVSAEPGLRAWINGRPVVLDLPGILEAAGLARTDPAGCVQGLLAIHDRMMTGTVQDRDRERLPRNDIAV